MAEQENRSQKTSMVFLGGVNRVQNSGCRGGWNLRDRISKKIELKEKMPQKSTFRLLAVFGQVESCTCTRQDPAWLSREQLLRDYRQDKDSRGDTVMQDTEFMADRSVDTLLNTLRIQLRPEKGQSKNMTTLVLAYEMFLTRLKKA